MPENSAENSAIQQIDEHVTGVRRGLDLFDVERSYITGGIKWSRLQEPLRSAKQELDEAVKLADAEASRPQQWAQHGDVLEDTSSTPIQVTTLYRRDVMPENIRMQQIDEHVTGVRRGLGLFNVERGYITEDIKWSRLQKPLRSAKQDLDEAVKLTDNAADAD